MYDFFAMSRPEAEDALSFWGTSNLELYSSSSRLGYFELELTKTEITASTYRNCKIVTSSQLCDLPDASERSTHDNGLVAMFLVVVEDLLDALDTWVFLLAVVLFGGCLVPIENAANKR